MKKFLLILMCIFLNFNSTFADWEITENENTEIQEITQENLNANFNIWEEIQKLVQKQVIVWTKVKIDTENIRNNLQTFFPEEKFSFEWSINWSFFQENDIFEKTFDDKWNKQIWLNIISTKTVEENEVKDTIYKTNIKVLVYEKVIPLIISGDTQKWELESYIQTASENWVYLFPIWPLTKSDLELTHIYSSLEKFWTVKWTKSNYVAIWWSRDFIFDVLSKINREFSISGETYPNLKIVWISGYNLIILNKYLTNFLNGKDWIEKMIILWEDAKFSIFKQINFDWVLAYVQENKQNHIDVSLSQNKINNRLFVSQFINNLSNVWYSNDDIYIFLIIPLIFSFIIIFKHIIGFSPIWYVLPLFITLTMLKLGIWFGSIMILGFLTLNITISFFTNKFNLLYSPKMTMFLSINIFFIIWFIDFLISFNLITLNLQDILFFILFVIINERFVNILISKDISEYKMSFIYTFLIAFISLWILSINNVKIFLLSYPEILILNIPLQFLIWRFTWLRITEYFRFKEIIKTIEEEE